MMIVKSGSNRGVVQAVVDKTMIKVKIISKNDPTPVPVKWGECLFTDDPACADYDWVVVYDEIPKKDTGTICGQTEKLACPREHTILVTVEPSSIKIYGTPYTDQFEYILTTQVPEIIQHRNFSYGDGSLQFFYGKPMQTILEQGIPGKTKLISTVCSSKQQKHTQHYNRYALTKYIAGELPELDWYGHGVLPIDHKYEALDDYKYHIAVENHIQPHHWTEKVSDGLVAGCLLFYAGDPLIFDCFPEGSIIPIPMDDHAGAVRIIKEAIENDEYSKRLPLIEEARRLLLERYNFYAQVAALIEKHHQDPVKTKPSTLLKGRHVLRLNPLKCLKAAWQGLKYKSMRFN